MLKDCDVSCVLFRLCLHIYASIPGRTALKSVTHLDEQRKEVPNQPVRILANLTFLHKSYITFEPYILQEFFLSAKGEVRSFDEIGFKSRQMERRTALGKKRKSTVMIMLSKARFGKN